LYISATAGEDDSNATITTAQTSGGRAIVMIERAAFAQR
jgi:hypothetical protein